MITVPNNVYCACWFKNIDSILFVAGVVGYSQSCMGIVKWTAAIALPLQASLFTHTVK